MAAKQYLKIKRMQFSLYSVCSMVLIFSSSNAKNRPWSFWVADHFKIIQRVNLYYMHLMFLQSNSTTSFKKPALPLLQNKNYIISRNVSDSKVIHSSAAVPRILRQPCQTTSSIAEDTITVHIYWNLILEALPSWKEGYRGNFYVPSLPQRWRQQGLFWPQAQVT